MDYQEIIDTTLLYADRTDAEVINSMPSFVKIVEARLNRVFKTSEQATRSIIVTLDGQEYYGLPSDFAGLRDIEIQNTPSTARQTLQYLSPEQMNDRANNNNNIISYTIIANQLHIYPAQDGLLLEIVYYQKIPPLTETNVNNWISTNEPQIYIFGLMVEINAFVKDPQTTQLWEQRFAAEVSAIESDDKQTRWSGTQLQVRIT